MINTKELVFWWIQTLQGGAWKEQARRKELNVAYFSIMLTKNNNNLLPLGLYQIYQKECFSCNHHWFQQQKKSSLKVIQLY